MIKFVITVAIVVPLVILIDPHVKVDNPFVNFFVFFSIGGCVSSFVNLLVPDKTR